MTTKRSLYQKPEKPTAMITYLEESEVQEFDNAADEYGVSRAAYLRMVVRRWLAEKDRNPMRSVLPR